MLCWETGLSRRFYQLAILDKICEAILSVIAVIVMIAVRRMQSGRKFQVTFRADLLTQRVLYQQILTWLGMWYSPLLCLLTMASVAVCFARDLVS